MKHLIISAAALALLAGSAHAQQNTAPSVAPAPAQTAPSTTPPPPPAELAPDASSSQSQQGGNNDSGSSNGSLYADDEDAEDMEGSRDDMRSQRRQMRSEYREHSRRWERDRPRWHGQRYGKGQQQARRGARFQVETDENGQIKLDVRCAANEPMQTCADVVNDLLDRLNSGGMSGNSDL